MIDLGKMLLRTQLLSRRKSQLQILLSLFLIINSYIDSCSGDTRLEPKPLVYILIDDIHGFMELIQSLIVLLIMLIDTTEMHVAISQTRLGATQFRMLISPLEVD